MGNRSKWHLMVLVGLVLLLTSSGIACQPTPLPPQAPAPTPSPAPAPTPTPPVPSVSLTEATMASEVDSSNIPVQTASVFTDDVSTIYCCAKLCNAPADTRVKAEWIYVGGEHSDLLNSILFEDSLIGSGTRHLKFSQNRPSSGWSLGKYEVVLYLNGEQNRVVPFSIVETSPPPPEPEVKELLVDWISGKYSGTRYKIEGLVRNVGTVPLDDIQIEVSCYDADGVLIMTESAPLEPSLVAVSGSAHFRVELQQAKRLKTYNYRFVTASGESIPFKRGD